MVKLLSSEEIAEIATGIYTATEEEMPDVLDLPRMVSTLQSLDEANNRRRAGIKQIVNQLRACQTVAADMYDILSGLVIHHKVGGEAHQSWWDAAEQITADNGESSLSAVELPEYVKTDFTDLFDAASHYWEENRLRVLTEKKLFMLKVMLAEERGEITETAACKLLKLYRVEYREQCHATFSEVPAELRALLEKQEGGIDTPAT